MALDSSIWKKTFDTVHGEVVMATLTVDGSTRSGNEDGRAHARAYNSNSGGVRRSIGGV